MLLTVDIGNTNTVLGLFHQDELVDSWRVKTDAAILLMRSGYSGAH